jgi:hypothetical protein
MVFAILVQSASATAPIPAIDQHRPSEVRVASFALG